MFDFAPVFLLIGQNGAHCCFTAETQINNSETHIFLQESGVCCRATNTLRAAGWRKLKNTNWEHWCFLVQQMGFLSKAKKENVSKPLFFWSFFVQVFTLDFLTISFCLLAFSFQIVFCFVLALLLVVFKC